MIIQKAKGYPIKEKYQNSFTQWDVIVSKRTKRSNVMTEKKKMESNVKLQVMLSVLWEVIYAYFYNWDGSHDLVLIVYALVELIIEASH